LLVVAAVLSIGMTVQASALPTDAKAAEPLAWSAPETIDAPESFAGVSCSSASLCVVGDNEGHILTSIDPAGGPSTWSKTESVDAFGTNDISCVVGLCVSADGNGGVVTATDPTKGTSAWQLAHDVDETIYGFNAMSCAATTLCVGVDYSTGDVVTSTDPTGGAPSWTTTNVDGTHPLLAVACPTTSLCVAGDNAGNILTSTNPAGGASAWSAPVQIDPGSIVEAIACRTATFCVAVDNGGNVLTSSNPTGGASAWSAPVQIDPNSSELGGISCPTTSLCVTVDDLGNVVTSSDPTGGPSAWHLTNVEGGSDFEKSLNGVSCPTAALCVVTDIQGHVIIGTPPSEEAKPEEPQPHPEEPKAHVEPPPPVIHVPAPPAQLSPAPITTAQLVAVLKQQLTPHGTAASLHSLLKHGGLVMPFTAPEAGTLSVGWYLVPKGARLAKHPKPVLVASGRLSVAAATPGQLKLRLTAAGKRQLKHAKRVKLVARATLVPSGGTAVVAIKPFGMS
jgi:hypothetical protein